MTMTYDRRLYSNNHNFQNWISFDLEWLPAKDNFHQIVTFAYEDCYGNQRAIDISDFETSSNPSNELLYAIRDKLALYDYCVAWGSKSTQYKNQKTGRWEGVNGDLAVLDNSFLRQGIKSIVTYDKFSGIPYIKSQRGGTIADVDLLKVFEKPLIKIYFEKKYPSLKLHDVANVLLGYGKLGDKSGANITQMSVEERKKYCKWDAHLVANLVKIHNGEVIKIMEIIADHTGLKLEQVFNKGMTGMWTEILNESIHRKGSLLGFDNIPYALKKLYLSRNIYTLKDDWEFEGEAEEAEDNDTYNYFSSNPDYDILDFKYSNKDKAETCKQFGRGYKGGIVLEPIRGLHYNVYQFDVTSLYPTIIINYNLSPETVNCFCCKNDPKSRVMLSKDVISDCNFLPKEGYYWICQRQSGLFAKLLQNLTEKRKKYKEEGLNLESHTIKSIINSGYGVFGHPNFKYYDPRVAELVTALGRNTLTMMKEIANGSGFNILYGDTDSLFVNTIKNQQDALRFIEICKSELAVNVVHERIFDKLILVRKKHYVGKSGSETIVKGMEAMKSDRPEFIRRTFQQIVEDFRNGVNPLTNLKAALDRLDRKEIPREQLKISLPLRKNPEEYEKDCIQKRLGLKLGLRKGDILTYYKCNLKQEFHNETAKVHISKKISESTNPNDVDHQEYKDMLIRSVEDVMEVLGYKIENIYERSVKEENCTASRCSTSNTRMEAVSNGISEVLTLLDNTSSSVFPRKIMTKITNGQVIASSIQEMLCYFENANFEDCRVNAFPPYGQNTEMKPNFILIDLDIQTKMLQELEISLSQTLDNIHYILGGYPAVLWTGNGYHVYQPVEASTLENLERFKEFQSPSLKFLRFAEEHLADGKSDPSHRPSFRSCMLRIPGTINSKCNEEVRLIQKWDGYKPPFLSLLASFHTWLNSNRMRKIENEYSTQTNQRNRAIWWIENLLLNPIDDYRKNAISLIIAPYLINIKKLTWNEAYNVTWQWLCKCNSLRRLDFDIHYFLNYALNNSKKTGFKPMRFSTLNTRNKKLHDMISGILTLNLDKNIN